MYKVLVDIDYDPTGKHYEVGKLYSLKGWRKQHISSAVQAGLIKKVGEEEKQDGRTSHSE